PGRRYVAIRRQGNSIPGSMGVTRWRRGSEATAPYRQSGIRQTLYRQYQFVLLNQLFPLHATQRRPATGDETRPAHHYLNQYIRSNDVGLLNNCNGSPRRTGALRLQRKLYQRTTYVRRITAGANRVRVGTSP